MKTSDFKLIPRASIVPSKTNPRKHFDDIYLNQLAASIADKGIVEPLVVRPKGEKFELVVGECRYRSAGIAKLEDLPCVVRELTDPQALEIQIIENLHRKDLTPLEEAAAFRSLIKSSPDKHSAASIGERIGKSASWVWDIMKLLDLIPEAQELLNENRVSVNHAILIARLKPDQQTRAIRPGGGGLFQSEGETHMDFGEEPTKTVGKYDGYKARTVRELAAWINDHIRFDVKHAAQAAPLQFEAIAEKVDQAAARPGRGKKVIAITRDSYVQPEAKNEERTFTERSWRRADGTKATTHVYPNKWVDSPTCEYSVLGCVVVGPGQGEVFEVCINREKCAVHFGKEIKAKASRQREAAKGSNGKPVGKSQYELQREREEAQRQRAEARWKTFGPALKAAMVAKMNALPTVLSKAVFQKLLHELQLPKTIKQAELAHALAVRDIKDDLPKDYYNEYWERAAISWANTLGVNVKALQPKKEPLQTSGVAPKPTVKKKAAKKR